MNIEVKFIVNTERKVLGSVFTGHTAGLAFVNRTAAEIDPFTDPTEKSFLQERNFPFAGRTNIEQVVCADFTARTQCFDEVGQGLVVEVRRTASPVCIKRVAHFGCKVFAHTFTIHRSRTSLFEGYTVKLKITGFPTRRQASIVHNNCFRLMLADHTVKSIFFPVFTGLRPVSVKPQPANFTVFTAQHFHGIAEILEVRLEIRVEIRMVPVQRGMIEEGDDSNIVAGIHIFTDQVTARCGMRSIVCGKAAGIVKREPFVVASGQSNILHAGCFCGLCDLVRIKLCCRKGLCKFLVLVYRNTFLMHDPFTASELGIQPPVNEHTKSELFKLGNTFFGNRNSHNESPL